MRNRFEKNRPLLQSLAMFSPSGFPELVKNFQTAHNLEANISSFCTTYRINPSRCAEELFTFAPSFQMFKLQSFHFCQRKQGRCSRCWWFWFSTRIWWERWSWFRSWWRNRRSHLCQWSSTEQRCTIFCRGPRIPITTWSMHIQHFVKCTRLRL